MKMLVDYCFLGMYFIFRYGINELGMVEDLKLLEKLLLKEIQNKKLLNYIPMLLRLLYTVEIQKLHWILKKWNLVSKQLLKKFEKH